MRLGSRGAGDFEDGDAPRDQCVGDQRAVTAPGDGFGAHDRGGAAARFFYKDGQAFFELGRFHVVGVAAEGQIAPGGVGRILAGVAQASEVGQVQVLYVSRAERVREGVAVELGIMARSGNSPDVDEQLDSVGFQERDEVLDGPG